MPLLEGLGYLETFYRIIEKRNEFDLTKSLGVRRQDYTFIMVSTTTFVQHSDKLMWDSAPLCAFVQAYILWFFRAVIDRQTWSDKGSISERRLRSEVLSLACHLDDPPCLERARQSFKDWLQSNGTLKYVRLNYSYHLSLLVNYALCKAGAYHLIFHHVPNMHDSTCVYLSLPTDVAETVYSVGAQDDYGWASLLHTYNISLSAAQKSKILFALTCSKDTDKLQR